MYEKQKILFMRTTSKFTLTKENYSMNYQIKQLSIYAEQILPHLVAGTIHSVYRRTVNLTDGKQILSLQTDGSPLSPVSLICGLSADSMNTLNIKAGDKVLFDRETITLQGRSRLYRFTYTDAVRLDLKITRPLTAQTCSALASNIRTALSVTETNGFSLLFRENPSTDDLSLILSAARNFILHCNEFLLTKDFQKAAAELSRLLGLGIGLTPSGDDFLCGVLAGLVFTGSSEHPFTHFLKKEITGRLSDTIDISAAFLSCALEDQYSLPVNNLCRLPAPGAILTDFEAIGHSSGIDTLCGILWCLEHIAD